MLTSWLVKTRRGPSRYSRDARVYGHTTTAMHKRSTFPKKANKRKNAWLVKTQRAPSRHGMGCEGLWSYDHGQAQTDTPRYLLQVHFPPKRLSSSEGVKWGVPEKIRRTSTIACVEAALALFCHLRVAA